MKMFLIVTLAAGLSGFAALAKENTQSTVRFDEVYKLISEHLADSDDSTINSAAVQGLLKQLNPHVQLNPAKNKDGDETPLITQTNRFNRDFGYVRISAVRPGLEKAFAATVESMLTNGPLRGIVIDLRFAGGSDYGAAAEFAGLFADKVPVVIKAAKDEFKASTGGKAILIPVMVLANGETTGSAEAAAAVLREIKAALIIGSNTAGRATVFEDFKLSNGDTIRIATEPVRLGSGQAIPLDGVVPDIAVSVSPKAEKVFLSDPYFIDKSGDRSTNGNRRITEADLVRQRREGISLEQVVADRENGPTNKVVIVTDPSLARALDVLKALTVVENWKQD